MMMEDSLGEFQQIVIGVLTRFFAQMARSVPPAQIQRFAAQLAEVVAERGLPRPLADGECGAPGGLGEEENSALVARVMAGLDATVMGDAAKQLVKACFYSEFKVCRDSFREVTRDGVCRRQDLERVRSRISGTHCVDCPHWVALTPDQHGAYLKREWRDNLQGFTTHRDVFLPEDFRALRRWLHTAARRL